MSRPIGAGSETRSSDWKHVGRPRYRLLIKVIIDSEKANALANDIL
jgi:hypothetical protein